MSDVTMVKEVVKEKLLGAETAQDVQLSAQSKATFEKYAQKDEDTGESFLGEEEFINAVAPAGEDYVSRSASSCTHPEEASADEDLSP